MGESVVLTFENLYEVLRREKNHEDLQKIDDKFFDYVASYLYEKKLSLESVSKKSDIFSHKEKENLTIQINNIKKVLKELYDRREQKILNLALNKSKTNSSLIDASMLTIKEKNLFEKLSLVLGNFRQEFLNESFEKEAEKIQETPKTEEIKDEEFIKIQFLTDIDTFMGRELEEYGPFKENETVNLPQELAEILIEEGKAKKL